MAIEGLPLLVVALLSLGVEQLLLAELEQFTGALKSLALGIVGRIGTSLDLTRQPPECLLDAKHIALQRLKPQERVQIWKTFWSRGVAVRHFGFPRGSLPPLCIQTIDGLFQFGLSGRASERFRDFSVFD